MRVFTVIAGVTFTLQKLTVTNGATSGSIGGGVYDAGALGVTNVTFSGNSTSYDGGGIYNSSRGTVDVPNSAFSGLA
jgi:predicted outer membrane repeat protein